MTSLKSFCETELGHLHNSGFKAVATSSAAIAESLGYKDGEHIPFAELLYIVQRIKARISIPLSVDIERGYTNDLEATASCAYSSPTTPRTNSISNPFCNK
jgi:2-methylisocitrate lyase-like PEP mutase family enzyme